MNNNNSTTNAILVILVVIIVGFIVWFVMARRGPAVPATTSGTPSSLEVNVNGQPASGGAPSTGASGATANP